MNYLFFDIECANNYNKASKIYSFGYVLTDEKFNILNKEDIYINPDSPFEKHILENFLTYPLDLLLKQPKFDQAFLKIKEVLTKENQLIFGFAVHNDADFILDECKRYNLICPNITLYDTQFISRKVFNDESINGLEKYILKLNIKQTENFHESISDAYYTMLVLKECENRSKVSVDKLILKYPNSRIRIFNNQIYKNNKKKQVNAFNENLSKRFPDFFKAYK